MITLLNTLNEAQQKAVTAGPGPVLVLAGPGSGKTRVLTFRIAYLIQEKRVPPWHILAVTFTNKAAREMRQRIEDLLGEQPRGLTMGTFHATCVRILRRETDNLVYYDRDFVIFDTADQQQVVKQALKDLNLDEKKFPPNKLLNGISNAKNELVTPELFAASNYLSEITRRVYAQYQKILQANNAMDFDDLLMNTVLLFMDSPEVLSKYQMRYEHILVDEFQDTNTTQYTLLRLLAAHHQNLFVVGDSDQSIYKWRGADFRNIQKFREQFPEAQQVLLEQNYRSTQIILDAAKAVIKHNSQRVHKELFTLREGGAPITVHEAYNEHEEAEFIAAAIEKMMLEGYSGGDMAVMYRTNAQSRALEETFLRIGLPYRLVGATEFYKRREVKDAIAYMRLVHNPADVVSFGRVLNVPPRGIGTKTRQELLGWAEANGQHPALAVIRLATDPAAKHNFSGRALKALTQFGELLNYWISRRDLLTVAELLELILEQISYRQYLDDGTSEGADRWENVLELRGAANEEPEMPLSEFLEQITLVSEVDNLEESPNATTLLTLHAAKGLEFPVVFLAGLEDGLLPHSRSKDDAEELAEERRLFYVGITRAKDHVFLTHAFRRSFYGDTSVSAPSRFLGEIPPELLDGPGISDRRRNSKKRASQWSTDAADTVRSSGSPAGYRRPTDWNQEWERSRPGVGDNRKLPLPRDIESEPLGDSDRLRLTELQFRSGQRVKHTKFGVGTVIESKRMGTDEEVSVAFKDGIKRLSASFAKLEIVD